MSAEVLENRPLLVAAQVTRRFGGLIAVNKVDFTIPEHSIVSLIGPNGAGKTTFFNVLLGVIDPSSGEVQFRGDAWSQGPSGSRSSRSCGSRRRSSSAGSGRSCPPRASSRAGCSRSWASSR